MSWLVVDEKKVVLLVGACWIDINCSYLFLVKCNILGLSLDQTAPQDALTNEASWLSSSNAVVLLVVAACPCHRASTPSLVKTCMDTRHRFSLREARSLIRKGSWHIAWVDLESGPSGWRRITPRVQAAATLWNSAFQFKQP